MDVPLKLFRSALATVFLIVHSPTGAEMPGGEHDLKAAYIYNFIRFVEWPGTAGKGDIVVCVAGNRGVAAQLHGHLEGKKVGERSIVVEVAATPSGALGCDVLYVADPDSRTARRYVDAVSRDKVLTITEIDRFPSSGSLINFFLDDDTIRFAVNSDLLAETKFKLSSQMLQFGTMVSAKNSGS